MASAGRWVFVPADPAATLCPLAGGKRGSCRTVHAATGSVDEYWRVSEGGPDCASSRQRAREGRELLEQTSRSRLLVLRSHAEAFDILLSPQPPTRSQRRS